MAKKNPQGAIIGADGVATGMVTTAAPPVGMVWFQTTISESGEAATDEDGKITRPPYSRIPGDVYLEVEETAKVRESYGYGIVLTDYQPVEAT